MVNVTLIQLTKVAKVIATTFKSPISLAQKSNQTLLKKTMSHIKDNISDLADQEFGFTQLVSFIASGFMVFGGIVPYMPQYQMIKRSRNAQGFSTLVCLSLLVANILRILFWFGHRFETPLLMQSIIMIGCMLIMLELCVRVKRENSYANSAGINPARKFADFDTDYFWKWTDYGSHIQFLVVFTTVGAFLTNLLINQYYFIEFIGFAAVFAESMLAAPQFYRNFINKSTEGMSVTMVLMWTSGDIFKTTYFILKVAPTQFWLCGMLQVSLDLAVLCQVYMYGQNKMPVVSKD